jgi:cell division protein FtsQ
VTRETKRKGGGIRWRLWLGLAGALIVLVGVAVAWMKTREFLARDARYVLSGDDRNALVVAGAQHCMLARVRHVFDADLGHAILNVPLDERRRQLLAINWIEDASVSRLWPDRLVVRIRERTPVAFVHLGNNVVLIDADGVLLEPPPQAEFSFPVLSGIAESANQEARRERVRALLRLERDMGYMAKDISEVDANDPENLRVVAQVNHEAVSLLMGDENYGRRYQNFLGHFQEIQQRLPDARTFDLRLEDQITVKE